MKRHLDDNQTKALLNDVLNILQELGKYTIEAEQNLGRTTVLVYWPNGFAGESRGDWTNEERRQVVDDETRERFRALIRRARELVSYYGADAAKEDRPELTGRRAIQL